jgi:lipoate-protein ligase A
VKFIVWSDLAPRSGAMQMAIDHALLDLSAIAAIPILRLYCWDRDTISFGTNEAAVATWDRSRIESAEVPCVRRPTGGRAVWHSTDDLTYSVVGPIRDLGELRTAYRAIHERIIVGFTALGLPATLAPRPPRLPGLKPGACFDVAVGGEVLIGGRKVVGSAQVAHDGAMLQHGAIARADRLAQLGTFRRGAPPGDRPTAAAQLPAVAVLADAIAAAWRGVGATPADTELTARAQLMSMKHHEHYQDPAWTWRR